jgi:hypothetical protein
MSIIQEALKKAQTIYTKENVKVAASQKPDTNVDLAAQQLSSTATPLAKLMPGVILLILIAGFGWNSLFSKAPAGTRKYGPQHNVSYESAVNDNTLKNMSDKGLGMQAKDVASPIRSAISSGVAFVHAPDLELNGIMYLQDRPRAIINGNMVEAGESVSGARINTITRDSVLLNYNDLEITLKLKE